MAVQVLISNQVGLLPVQATFMAPGDMPMYLEVTGFGMDADCKSNDWHSNSC